VEGENASSESGGLTRHVRIGPTAAAVKGG
jgi:hypothetical protein